MLSVLPGTPDIPNDIIQSMSLRTFQENAIPFAAGETRTEEVSMREFPITEIALRLKIVVAGASGAETVNQHGVWNLIRECKITVDGTDHRYALPGKLMEKISRQQFRQKPFNNFNPAANGTYYAVVRVKLDAGGYQSCLDASRNGSLAVQCNFGVRNDAITGGAATITGEVKPIVTYVHGGMPGKPGGKGGSPWASYITYSTIDVASTRPDLRLEKLINDRAYHGLSVFSFDNTGASSDAIVNELTLIRAGNQHQKLAWPDIRACNVQRYNVDSPADFVGLLDLPMVDDGHAEHMLTVDSTQAMTLDADVTKPGGGDGQVVLVSHFFLAAA